MDIFEHPIWPYVLPYVHVGEGRDNVDLLELPDEHLALALGVRVNCIACGNVIFPFRRRKQSERARIAGSPEERRLFYAGTCPSDQNPGCSRTTKAGIHKEAMMKVLGRGGPDVYIKRAEPVPSHVFNTYWRFAAERQAVYFRKLRGLPPPYTHDPILAAHRFTNCYRAADRVSQYLIRYVIYSGSQEPKEVIFRTLLFKIFNKIETWESLHDRIETMRLMSNDMSVILKVLDEMKTAGDTLYSAAYVMPSPKNAAVKHVAHLELLQEILNGCDRLLGARSLEGLYDVLRTVPSFGPFLAYQYAIDLNYSTLFNFSENEFVVPGPGARDGLRKCFTSLGDYDEADTIRWTCERQDLEFERLGLKFDNLFGRKLHLSDNQNIFCEVSKYARAAHPEVEGVSGRTRIKQLYKPDSLPFPPPFFPPKWGLLP